MPRYYPLELKEETLPHVRSDMYEPLPMSVSEMFTWMQDECTYSGLTNQQLEENTGLIYLDDARVILDRESDDFMQGVYSMCECFYYSYPSQHYIALATIRADMREMEKQGTIAYDRPHYDTYHSKH